MPRSKYLYGWKPDHKDDRDFLYKVSAPVQLQDVDLSDKYKMPDIFDQGRLGSCTANAIAFMLAFNILNKQVQNDVPCDIPFSRLFIYYNERAMEGNINRDSGAQIRDGLKAVANLGACSEKTWPYIIQRFTEKPSVQAYKEALQFRDLTYSRVNNTSRQDIVSCLLAGFPFVLGFRVYESFESQDVADTGIVPMPGRKERLLGGHAVCATGYKLKEDRIKIANSWGANWGQNGYFTIPADFICNPSMASDAWQSNLIL